MLAIRKLRKASLGNAAHETKLRNPNPGNKLQTTQATKPNTPLVPFAPAITWCHTAALSNTVSVKSMLGQADVYEVRASEGPKKMFM